MIGFLKKSKTTQAENGSVKPEKAAKVAEFRPRGLDTICPEVGANLTNYYAHPAQALGTMIKDLPLTVDADNSLPTRLEWQFAIAVEAINTLDNYPLQAVVNLHGEEKWDFHRAVFLRALVKGLGDWLNAHSIKMPTGVHLDVLAEGWDKASLIAPKRHDAFPVNAGMLEWDFLQKITGSSAQSYLNPSVYRLLMDAFGDPVNRNNPVAGSVQLAEEKMIKRYRARGIQIDSYPGILSSCIKQPAPQRLDATPENDSAPVAPAQASTKPTRQPAEPSQMKPPARKQTADKAQKGASPGQPNDKELQKAGIKLTSSMPTQKSQASTLPGSTEEVLENGQNEPRKPASFGNPEKPSLDKLINITKDRMETGVITVNQPGAIFFGTPNGPAIITPKGVDVIAQVMKESFEAVDSLIREDLTDASVSHPNVTYRVRRKGRGWAKIKACVLTPSVAAQLFPDGLPVIENLKVE